MAFSTMRRGHAAIGAIISDMEPFLPPDTIDRPGYKHCRTTYGLLTTTYKRAEDSEAPEKIYKELQQLENELRRRLNGLTATKGIPAKMTGFLDELKAALNIAITEGVDAEFLTQGMEDLLNETPDSQPAPKPERVRMVPDTKYKKVKAELAEANEKIHKLNAENNALTLRLKKLEAERAQRYLHKLALRSTSLAAEASTTFSTVSLEALELTMTLNKRTGLYSIPNHHLHGAQPASRPMFNSMDFAAEGSSSPSTEVESAPQVKESESTTSTQEHKDKKKHSMSTEDAQAMSGCNQAVSTPLITVTPATASTKGRKDKNAANIDKKRKRKSGDDFDHTPKSSGDGGLFVGADMVQKVQSSVKAAGEVFSSRKAGENGTEQRSKKKSKKDKAARNSTDTVDFDRIAKETRAIDKKARREKKLKRRTADAEAKAHSPVAGAGRVPSSPIFPSPPRKTPVPLPSIANMSKSIGTKDMGRVGRHKSKKAKRSKQHSDEGDPTPVDISSPPHPRKTPVPLPQNAFSHAANATKADRIGRRDSRLFVLDTPPSELPKTPVNLPDSPIPFKLTDVIKAKERTESNKVADPSPPTRTAVEPSFSAPPALNKIPKLELKPDGRASLTTSNLQKYTTTTELLSDQPKARLKTKSLAASTADSTTSGGTTPSIAALFERVGKPYSRSGAEHDPFTTTSSKDAKEKKKKKKSHLETHDEANFATFTTLYLPTQRAINFTDEAAYLSSAHTWRSANDLRSPLPCLGQKASGCNPKRETILRLTRDDATSQLNPKVSVASPNDLATLERAKQGAENAEKFLTMSIRARVPVPLGVVEGTWRLFCPAYGDVHVDRYGYGQRVLRIFSVPGTTTTSSSTESKKQTEDVDVQGDYTARLSIPPRSMLYPLLRFCTPPHASFRPITLKTSAEGYKLDVVFLGNGYLLLRVNLKLLLSGEGGTVMEFLGVHEGAVGWDGGEEEEEELERVGRRLCEKYDGVA